MKLDVRERIALAGLLQELSQKGDFAALKTLRRAKEMVAFSPEERELYEFNQGEDGIWRWNSRAEASNVKDIPVDEYTTNLVRAKLAQLNQDKELVEDHMPLYEKFVLAYK